MDCCSNIRKSRFIHFVLILLVLSACIFSPSCGKKHKKVVSKEPVVAVVAQSEGILTLKRQMSDWLESVCAGVAIYRGDMLRTGPGSSGTLIFTDSSRLDMLEGSDVEIMSVQEKPIRLSLTRGKYSLSSSSKLEIATPSGIVACENARVDVSLGSGGVLSISVLGGRVKVSNEQGDRTISRGEGLNVSPGEAPGVPVNLNSSFQTFSTGCGYFVRLLLKPYFSNEATRDEAEDDARDQVLANPIEPWGYVNLGRALLDAGKMDEARTQFTKALELNGELAQALTGMGKLSLYEGRWDEASSYYLKARNLAKNMLEPPFGLGMAALGKGDFNSAKKYFEEGLDIDSGDSTIWAALGVVQMFIGETDESRESFNHSLSSSENYTVPMRLLALLECLDLRVDRAQVMFEKVIDEEPDCEQVRLALGILKLRRGMNTSALSEFEKLTDSQDPLLKAVGFENAGVVRALSGHFDEASTDFEKSLDLAPMRPSALYNLGMSRLLGRFPIQALQPFSSAKEKSYGDWFYIDAYSRALIFCEHYEAALSEAKVLLGISPSLWSARIVSGIALFEKGEKGEGKQEISEGLESCEGRKFSPQDHYLLGKALEETYSFDEALKNYREASREAPSVAQYHYEAGALLEKMNRRDGAVDEYEKAIDIDPHDNRSRLRIASILLLMKREKDAKKELYEAIQKDEADADARSMLAILLIDEKDFKEAVRICEEGKEIKGIDSLALSKLWMTSGMIADRQGDLQKAISDYSNAVSYGPDRGDAWYYLACDLEKAGRLADAKAAYRKVFDLCSSRPEWKDYYADAARKLEQLK